MIKILKNLILSPAHKGGYAAVIAVLGIMAVSLIVVSSVSSSIIIRQKTARNVVKSAQSYYAAEAGIEDVVLRLMDETRQLPSSPHSLDVGGATATITITQDIGGNTTVESQGDQENRIRKLELVVSINTEEASFFYGAQAGEGGFKMGNNSIINGNVYSNGSIDGANGTEITGDAIVAGDGASENEIEDVTIGGNAYAPNFEDCTVGGDITFVTGGEVDDCSAGGSVIEQSDPIEPADMPISQEQIDGWKQDAQNAGIIASGDYEPLAGSTVTIGPGVITGDMNLGNNQTVILAGTVYVQGSIDIDNGASIQLSPSYGPASGILITDSWIHIKNNGEFLGSGHQSSYILLLSTSSCRGDEEDDDDGEEEENQCTDHGAAMDIHNNSEGAIFYAPNGLLHIHNNVNLTQATAWRLELSKNTSINYSLGLQSALFSGGSGASYRIDSWKEVQ